LRKIGCNIGFDENDVALDRAGGFGLVQNASRNPKRALRRHHPQRTFHLAGEHATQHQYQLALAVTMEIRFQPIELIRHDACGTDRHYRARHDIGVCPLDVR